MAPQFLYYFFQLVLYYWHIKQGIDVAIVQCGFVDLLAQNCASLSVNSSSVSVSYSSNCNEQDAVRLILLFLQRSAEVDECQEKLRGNVTQASINLDETLIIYRGVTSENLNFIIKISKSCSTWPLADKSELILIVCISLHGSAIPDWYDNNAVHFNNKRRIKRSHCFCPYYATSVASLRIQLACSGDIEVNPGPSGVEKLISLPGQNQNGRSENSVNTLWLTHLNCRSLLPHIDELRLIFETNKPFLIAVPETCLRHSVYDEEISIARFSVLRKDRKARRGGLRQRFAVQFI